MKRSSRQPEAPTPAVSPETSAAARRLELAIADVLSCWSQGTVTRGEVRVLLEQARILAQNVAQLPAPATAPAQLGMSLLPSGTSAVPGEPREMTEMPVAERQATVAQLLRRPSRVSSLKLSDEQDFAVTAAADHQVVKVRALAGTGKTTTLEAITARLGRGGTYLAFNRALRVEGRAKFDQTMCEVHTGHSVAYKMVVGEFKAVGKARAVGKIGLAEVLKFLGWGNSREEYRKAHEIRELMCGFCYSDAAHPKVEHMPKTVRVSIRARLGRQLSLPDTLVAPFYWKYVNDLCPMAEALYLASVSTSQNDRLLPLTHDSYLKLVALRGLKIKCKYLMIDEAQDLNPVMLQFFENQTHAKRIYCGDEFQQIYGFRGSDNALSRIKAIECPLTGSYRFGKTIAKVANSILDRLGSDLHVRGLSENDGELVDRFQPDEQVAYVYRTNAGVMGGAISALEQQIPFAVVGGVEEICNDLLSAHALWQGEMHNVHSELFRGYDTWDDVLRVVEDTGDGMLARIVKLITEHRDATPKLADSLKKSAKEDEKDAREIFATGHKVKGREYDNVFLGSDFQEPGGSGKEADADDIKADYNLLYVDVTRTKRKLRMNSVVKGIYESSELGVE